MAKKTQRKSKEFEVVLDAHRVKEIIADWVRARCDIFGNAIKNITPDDIELVSEISCEDMLPELVAQPKPGLPSFGLPAPTMCLIIASAEGVHVEDVSIVVIHDGSAFNEPTEVTFDRAVVKKKPPSPRP